MWKTIEPERRFYKAKRKQPSDNVLIKSDRVEILENILTLIQDILSGILIKILSIVIYGSCVTPNFNNSSDIDIMIIIKDTTYDLKNIWKELKKEISKRFNRRVDLVILEKTNKIVKNIDPRDEAFYDNVISNHHLIYGENILDFIPFCKKSNKIR